MTEIPLLKRQRKHAIGKSGRASEKRLIRQLEGKGRPASGAMRGAKGDIDLDDVLMEAKSTTAGSIIIKHGWLVKIAGEARSEGKSPALMISFTTEDGRAVKNGDWVLVQRSFWEASLK